MRTVGFLGCGNMGSSLACGISRKLGKTVALRVFDIDPERSAALAAACGATVVASAEALFTESEAIVLAVKPPHLESALAGPIAGAANDKLVVSIVAGASLFQLAGLLPGAHVVRTMPNTPAMLGAGAIAWSAAAGVEAAELDFFRELFGVVGRLFEVQENQMDAVTGLSGSGPAYAFLMINALADGAVREGLAKETALALAAQTMLGAALMVQESGEHPERLKDQVTSPGGTTAAGLAVLETRAVRGALAEAVAAATARSRELGRRE